jgi:hypothetical protein
MPDLRIYTAPGESPDLVELLDAPAEVREVASLSEVAPGRSPAVLMLSRSLLAGLAPGEWPDLPAHVTVVASDATARAAAEVAGRLFASVEHAGDRGPGLAGTLEAAFRRSLDLLTEGLAQGR